MITIKFRRSEKYDTIALYAFLTVTASVLICFAVTNITGFASATKKVLSVISPLTYGAVIAYLLNPMMKLWETKVFKFKKAKKDRKKLRRVLSIIATYVVIAALISAFIILLVPQIVSSYNDLTNQFSTYMSSALKWADSFVSESPLFSGKYENLSEFIDVNELTSDVKSLISNSFKVLETVSDYLISYAGKFVVEVKNVILGLFLSFYFLWMKEGLAARFKKLFAALFSRKAYINIVNVTRYTHEAFGSFLIGKILDSIIIGLLTFIVMGILRIPFYPIVALIIGITNIIPVFGPIFGAVPTGFIVLVAEPKKFLIFLVAVVVIQQLDGNLIGPKILGERSGISAMWIMISIVIGGGFFGVAGMILAVPTFVVIYTVVKQLCNARLKDKNMPCETDFYSADPPHADFSNDPVIIRHADDLPEKYTIEDDQNDQDDQDDQG